MRASAGWLLVLLVIGCGDCDDAPGGREGNEPAGDEDGFRWPGDGRAGDTAALGDGGRTRDAGADSGARSSGDAAAAAPGVDGGELADAGVRGDSGAPAGGSGGAGACDNDRDQDGVCNADDHCLGNGAEDSDADGACDGDDVCAGHDDRVDEDDDGAPDGCDTCPIGSDEDDDRDGFADLCDQVLWERWFDGTASFPYVAPRAALIAHKTFAPDTAYAEVEIELQTSAEFTISETDIADLIAALNINDRVLRTEFRYGSPEEPTATFVTAATDESPVNGDTPVWTRVVVRGFIMGATNNFTIEMRGYEP